VEGLACLEQFREGIIVKDEADDLLLNLCRETEKRRGGRFEIRLMLQW
jgi:hypothetical protein